jgi:hypothetical protein
VSTLALVSYSVMDARHRPGLSGCRQPWHRHGHRSDRAWLLRRLDTVSLMLLHTSQHAQLSACCARSSVAPVVGAALERLLLSMPPTPP